ncbi:helix-turn-helix domain-containing protein [Streptomyces sp. NPDC005322]|uniref:helix-turn-helix domain-containing protein n=1 Tax=Streptomyces sp. NPDC005322 TaxID=3157032 RepID=UPI0033B26AC2
MTAPQPAPDEDLSQLIVWIKDQTGDSESAIARRIGVSAATVNQWVHRKRGAGRGPRPENLRKLAVEYGIPEVRAFEAAGRTVPGELAPDRKQRIMNDLDMLTAEQQRMIELQIHAVAEGNRSAGS